MNRSAIVERPPGRNRRATPAANKIDRTRSSAPARPAATRRSPAPDFQKLTDLARLNGVQTSYLDMDGRRQEAAPEVLAAVLGALGVPANNPREIRDSLDETTSRPWRQCVEPVIVAWEHRPAAVRLHLVAGTALSSVRCRLQLESGEVREFDAAISDAPQPESRGAGSGPNGQGNHRVRQLTLPALPFGYHTLELDAGNRRCESLVISAPSRSYFVRDLRAWGFFLPMYAARSTRSWGAGNFTDWRALTAGMAALGGTLARGRREDRAVAL